MTENILLRKGLSLDRLACLLEIENAGGIAGAADGDSNRQSLMSRQISGLENALGATLLERSSKPHNLTDVGREIARNVRAFAKDLDASLESEGQTVTIAAGESVILWLLIPRLAELRGSIRFRNMRSKEAADAVRSEQVDLAVHHHETTPIKGELSEKIGRFGLTLVSLNSLEKSPERWSDLPNWELVTLEGNGTTRRKVNQLTAAHPDGPQIAMECTSYPQVLAACTMGLIGVVPEIARKQANSMGLQVTSISELAEEKVSLSMSWLSKNSEHARFNDVLSLLSPRGGNSKAS